MLDELKRRPGTKVSDRITIAESASRQDICLYYFGLWGAKDGPTLLLNAAVHGNEVVGVEVIRKIVEGHTVNQSPDLDDVLEADRWARGKAGDYVKELRV